MKNLNIRRFGLLMRNDLYIHRRLLGIAALIIITVQLFHGFTAYYFVEKYGFDPLNIFLFLGGFLLTAFSCKQLHTADSAAAFLMLPASALEKILSRYMLTSLGFMLFVLIVYTPADLLAREITYMLYHQSYYKFYPFHAQYPNYVLAYMVGHVFVFWSAVYFKKHTLIKIALVFLSFFLVFDIYMTHWLNSMIAHLVSMMCFGWLSGTAAQPSSPFLISFFDLLFESLPVIGIPLITLVIPFFWFLIYIQFKRYEC